MKPSLGPEQLPCRAPQFFERVSVLNDHASFDVLRALVAEVGRSDVSDVIDDVDLRVIPLREVDLDAIAGREPVEPLDGTLDGVASLPPCVAPVRRPPARNVGYEP